MFYVNFEENITAKYGVVCEGWPLLKFCSPGDIGSHTEVKVLNSAWKTGTAKFWKMSKAEFKQWDEGRFQPKLIADSAREHRAGSTLPQIPSEGSSSANPVWSSPTTTEAPALSTIETTSLPQETFVNVISGVGGKEVVGTKKARKTCSDKGKKRGSKRPQATNTNAPTA
ncbi:uncharacterized protein EDB91DRAFT_1085846 [Suillus paluster]|uniref:uncharacterized protein n=1 Tax=Suillus paluster TaxID=48578 RepID=UPI001B87706E|nr:uncharacterized protein EDB91DRAFT_1085846 [Suillus paluster]KAG1729063.1 hypothetical protein EDB91DRAFT_1085846 [Suillus paluster]